MKRVKKPKRERSTFTWKENRQICQDASRISMLLLLAALTDTRIFDPEQVKPLAKIADEEWNKLQLLLINDFKLSKVRTEVIRRYFNNVQERLEGELLKLKIADEKLWEVLETSVLYSQHLDNHLVKLQTIADSIEKQTGVEISVKGWRNG